MKPDVYLNFHPLNDNVSRPAPHGISIYENAVVIRVGSNVTLINSDGMFMSGKTIVLNDVEAGRMLLKQLANE